MKTWIVGCDENCDLRIDEPAVSGTHCRLSENEDGSYVLEDLGSTNGTFVNGEPIQGECAVTRSDQVTLGRSTPLQWPQASVTRAPGVITIGADPINDFVITAPPVSGNHAVLTVMSGTMRLEDLNSTNGTSVGTRENRISTATVNENDRVFLGSYETSVAEILRHQPARHYRQSGSAQEQKAGLPIPIIAAVGSGIAALILLLVVFFNRDPSEAGGTAGGDPRSSDVKQVDVDPGTNEQVATGASETETPVNPAPSKHIQANPDEPPAPLPPEPAEPQPQSAAYIIVVGSSQDSNLYRVGNAWAVTPKILLTTATVIEALGELRTSGQDKVAAYSPQSGMRLDVDEFGAHEGYAKVSPKFTQVDQLIQKAITENPEGAAAGDTQLQELWTKFFEIRQFMAGVNVGWIRLGSAASSNLPLADSVAIRPAQTIATSGYIIDAADKFLDLAATQEFRQCTARASVPMMNSDFITGWRLTEFKSADLSEAEAFAAFDSQSNFAGIVSGNFLTVPGGEPVFGLVNTQTIRDMLDKLSP